MKEFIENYIKKTIFHLSETIGERNYKYYDNLEKTIDYIINELLSFNLNIVKQQYLILNKSYYNIETEIKGSSNKVIVIGAHYDTILGGGANDNSSGVAGLLTIIKLLTEKDIKPKNTIKFVFFVNEEPPFFNTTDMGSYQYVKYIKQNNIDILGMICLDLIGVYTNEPNSQEYPPELIYKELPTIGNFLAFVGSNNNDLFIKKCENIFTSISDFPLKTLSFSNDNFFSFCSDHGSFSKFGYNSFLVTDTAFLRYPQYHTLNDTYEKINYKSLYKVILSLSILIEELSCEL